MGGLLQASPEAEDPILARRRTGVGIFPFRR